MLKTGRRGGDGVAVVLGEVGSWQGVNRRGEGGIEGAGETRRESEAGRHFTFHVKPTLAASRLVNSRASAAIQTAKLN